MPFNSSSFDLASNVGFTCNIGSAIGKPLTQVVEDIQSNMGADGKPLASLRAWRDYLPEANIYGADIDKEILINENRIKTFYVDQTNPDTIKKMFKEIGVEKFDVILEDGLHEFNANICCFENSIDYLSDEGVYIIEDIYYKDEEKFIKYFKDKPYDFSLINLFHKKKYF